MTFDLGTWSGIAKFTLLVAVVMGLFLLVGALWDWTEKRVNRHATQRWLERQRKKESEANAESRHDQADH